MRRLLVAGVAAVFLATSPAFAENAGSPLTIQNAVGNTGNTSGTAAVSTTGNVNQNTNQNSVGQSQGLNLGIGSISITPATGGAAGAADPGYVGSYSGTVNFASPAINFGSSKIFNTNLLGLPGILGPTGNFSQPYKPDVFVNGAGPVRPSRITREQAEECRGGWGYKDKYVGASRGKTNEMTLVYAAWDKIDITNDISNYVGISSVEGSDKPWLPGVCEAAYHAMEHGANYGIVEFIIRPKNSMKGFGFGSSGGGSVVPSVVTASPYGLAASLGFGLGWSSQKVEGEVMIQLTGLKLAPQAVTPAAPAAQPAPAAPQAPTPAQAPPAQPSAPAAEKPATGEPSARPADGKVIQPGGQPPLKLPAPTPPGSGGPQPVPGDGQQRKLDVQLDVLAPADQWSSSYLRTNAGGGGLR